MEKKTKIGIYFAWNYDKEEVRVNSMAKEGWQLKKAGSCFHKYEKSDNNYRYKIDYNTKAKFNNEEYRRYLSFYEEQGWELINATFNGWYYFRKPYIEGSNDEDYELYTDNETLKHMLNRWSLIGRIIQIAFIIILMLSLISFILEKRYSNGFVVLSAIFVILLFQSGITSMKRKSVGSQYKESKCNYLNLILLIGFIISFVLIFTTNDKYYYVNKVEYTQKVNKDTEKVIEDMTVDKDGSYTLDIRCRNERGVVIIQILKDDKLILTIGESNYSATYNLDLEKGEYQIVVEYYFDNLEDVLPTPITKETLEMLNLTGDLEEYSEVKVLVGLR